MVGPWLDYGSADHGPTWPIVKIGPTWPNLAQRQPSFSFVVELAVLADESQSEVERRLGAL